jgi:cystathionine beta-lyase
MIEPMNKSDPKKPDARTQGRSTRLVHGGRPPSASAGPVNPPVMRASTVLYADVATMKDIWRRRAAGERLLSYGRRGTDTAFALEDALAELEGGYRARLLPSGLAAIALVFLAFARPGEHVLIADSVYEPVRRVCKGFLDPFGIRHTFFAADGGDLEAKIEADTRLIYAECPGSLVFEMIDLRRVAAIARARGIVLAADNTWGSGWLYNPLALGADISVLAATKYIVGHSDAMLGAVVSNEAAWDRLAAMADTLGHVVSPDDAYLGLRGLRTLAVRLPQHERNARTLIAWFQKQPEVRTVFFPALPEHPGHDLWQRDFTGACGLFSIEFQGVSQEQVERFIDALKLFGLGASWGGFESLVLPENVAAARTVADWSRHGPIVRFHAGLEDTQDLIADLEQGMHALRAG